MMRYYCTLFDSNYLAKGIAMIASLLRWSKTPTQILVLAMDETTAKVLRAKFPETQAVVVDMDHFENSAKLGDLRRTRTHQEFCWSCGAIFIDWLIDVNPAIEQITYIDADCFFFSDPEVVFAEIGSRSIAITPHRFAPKDERRLLPNGKYAVQWVTFQGEVGMRCLEKWAGQVRDWCYYRHEDGKFADQKYLDSWPTDYPGEVCEIANIGVGTAPWNLQRYDVSEGPRVDAWPVVMYHFHEYIHGQRLTGWPLRPADVELIYKPYIRAIDEAMAEVCKPA